MSIPQELDARRGVVPSRVYIRLVRLLFAALALLAPQDPSRPRPDEDRLAIDCVTEDFQRRWDKAETEKDWPELLKLFDGAVERFPRRLAQPDPDVPRWLRLTSVLSDRLATILPESAREEREIVAQQLLDTLQDREGRARVIEKYGYTRAGRRAIEQQANSDYDEGRLRDAIRGWSRAMETRLSPELVARLAHAHAAAGDPAALAALRAQAERLGCKGEVTVGGRRRELHDFLEFLQASPGAPSATAPLPLERAAPPANPSTEISLGAYDLKGDGGALGRREGSAREWGMHPALAPRDGRDQVIVTNGLRVIAFDATAAEGGSLENAVEWRYPKEGTVRYWMPTIYGGTQPQVGVAVAGGRAFATMFSKDSRQGQVGRRPDRFDGPGAIRALDLATGELLWDTDSVEVGTADGSRRKLLEELPFGRLNFCFAGPPVVRGDRLFAAGMTMTPDRSCYIVCLDPANGGLRWCRWVGSAPATRERSTVPAFAEEDGTLVVSTSFGLVAALDSETGTIDWLVKYQGQGNRAATNPPVFHHGLVTVLAQDRDEPLVYDRWTGREASMPVLKGEVSWPQVTRLVGRAGSWMVFSGISNCAVHAATGEVVRLGDPELARPAAGSIVNGLLYLPSKSLLHVYDTATWERKASFPWQGGEDAGHLVVSGSLCAYLGDKLELFTSPAALKDRFASKADASPPRAEPCRQLARILEGSGRAKESVAYYRRALATWEKDPAWRERTEEMRKKLADLEEKLGDDFPKP
jgi:outer membrane protein assembly factor BamB